MPKDIIQKLFTRTGILGNNTIAEKSAGLGLYIAKHFMEIQKGSIHVTSEVGKGTTFTFRLPLAAIHN
jgi:signal transduction histidine kinase